MPPRTLAADSEPLPEGDIVSVTPALRHNQPNESTASEWWSGQMCVHVTVLCHCGGAIVVAEDRIKGHELPVARPHVLEPIVGVEHVLRVTVLVVV